MRYSLLLILILIITLMAPLSLRGTQDNSNQDNPKEENVAKQKPEKSSNEKTDAGNTLNLKPEAIFQPGQPVPALPDSDSISFVKSLMALCFVLGLIFLVAYFFKRFTGMKATGFRTSRVIRRSSSSAMLKPASES